MRRLSIRILPAVVAAAAFTGCDSSVHGEDGPAAPQAVLVEVAPPSATVQAGGSVAFAAAVTGTANTAVTWTVVEPGGGSVDPSGRYTAPAAPGTFRVRATAVADPLAHGDGTVTVRAPVAVAIAPRTASVVAGRNVTFTATVTGSSDTAVTWSVAGPSCGSITQAGVYTAPASPATCSVVATSRADPTKSDTATVTVTAPPPIVSVAVTPSPGATNTCRTLAFSATVTGTTNQAVAWAVQEGAAGGTITAAGLYTAPENAGTYHVVATSAADSSKSAIATVSVTDRILSVAVSPATAEVQTGGTVQFTATVTTTCGSYVSMGPSLPARL